MRSQKPRAGIFFYLGIIVFFYFSFDLAVNDYPLKITLLKGMLAGAGLLLPLVLKLREKE
ncbi:hypothetical protein SAMN02745221_00246 [Thermosyntropha lipolytica DSM 11003]|uniref:Uncharacterized protein n=1 Tax=Thermosyntropha lipolytica DSM 11003 TaxID=1123382 RepID=A0A1M5JW51_9FIRM|nr:hypothetical protein [Thermosyntropha lipolytica]SHG44758.1 hypothetical protein SAMN02745221_00246 [Thermosyntropha lipolytica DSM 11003]